MKQSMKYLIQLFFFIYSTVFAQKSQYKLTFLSDDPIQSRKEVEKLILKYQGDVLSKETGSFHLIKADVPADKAEAFKNELYQNREIQYANSNQNSPKNEIAILNSRIENLKHKKQLYKEHFLNPLKYHDSLQQNKPYKIKVDIEDPTGEKISQFEYTTDADNKQTQSLDFKQRDIYLEKIMSVDDSILQCQNKIKELEYNQNKAYFEVKFNKRINAESEAFSLVNMPGISYQILTMDNPNSSLSYSSYAGPRLKYLFTKGKTYFTLGSLKEISGESRDHAFDEIFIYTLGTDFYPKYLGRGKRTWLNIHTGVEFGGALFINEDKDLHLFNLQPKVGLEIYKSSRVLLDIGGAYFVPLTSKYNRDFKGYLGSASFNFIF